MAESAREHFVQLSQHRLHVAEQGAGPPLLLLHGFTGSAATLTPLSIPLATDFRVLTVDLPGHGFSDAPAEVGAFKMENVVLALAELLDRFDIVSTRLFGYSMGGRTALAFNAIFPDRVEALAVLGATPGIEAEQERQSRRDADEELARFIVSRGLEAFVERWMDNPLFASQKRLGPAFLEASRSQRMSNNPHALAACLRGMGTGVQKPFYQELEGVRTPILLLAGALDGKFRDIALKLVPRLQNAETVFIEDAGHAAHLERPEQVQQVLGRFFKGVSRPLEANRQSTDITGVGNEKG